MSNINDHYYYDSYNNFKSNLQYNQHLENKILIEKRNDEIEVSRMQRIIFSVISIIYFLFIVVTTWAFMNKAKPYTPLSSKGVSGVVMLASGTLIVGLSVFIKLAIPELPCYIFYWIYYIGYLVWFYSFIIRCMKIQYLFKWNISKIKKSGNWKVNLFKSQKDSSLNEDKHNKGKRFTTFNHNYIYSSSRFQRSLKLPTNRFNDSFIIFILLVFILLLIILLSIPQFMSDKFSPNKLNCSFGGAVDYLFMLVKVVFFLIICPMFFFFILEVNESFGVKHNLFIAILLGIPCQLFEYIPQMRLSDVYSRSNSSPQIYYCILDVLVMFAVHLIDVARPVSEEYNIPISFTKNLFNILQLKKRSNDVPIHSEFDTFERVMNVPQLFKTFKYFCVTDYAIVNIIFYERWRDIREQVMLYNYYKKRAQEGPSSSKGKFLPQVYNIDNSSNNKGMASSNITQPRMRNFSAAETIKGNMSVHSDYTYINNNNSSQTTSQASSTFSDNFQPIYYFDDNKTPLNKMPDILIPPCLLPLFIGLYQTFINSGSIFELSDIPVDKLERLSNQIMQSPLYYHFISNLTNKNMESNENLSNDFEDIYDDDDDDDNGYHLERYANTAKLYSQASSYESINNRPDDLRTFQSTGSAATKVMSYSHSGYAFLQSASGSNFSTGTTSGRYNSNTNATASVATTTTTNTIANTYQPRCLFNYEEINFEEDEAMSIEINLSCTLFDEILDTIYTRIYEYSFSRFISDNKNRKLVNNTLKSIHKQRKKRKNGKNNTGTSRNTQSQSNNTASCSQTKDNISVKDKLSYKHHNKSNSQGSIIKFGDSSNKSYSSHNTYTRSGHHQKFNSNYSNRNNEANTMYNDKINTDEGSNNENLKYDNNDDSILYDNNNNKIFIIGNDNQLSTQTSYDIKNKDNKSVNTINNAHNNISIINNQENTFNTYPLNNSNNKGKDPFNSVDSNYSHFTSNSNANNLYINNGNGNIIVTSNNSSNNNLSIINNNNDNNNININNMNNNNFTYNNERQKKRQEPNVTYESSYHDDLSVFWESEAEEENEENISIHESMSEEELVTPQLKDERTSDLFKKNMESFRQKLLGSSGNNVSNASISNSNSNMNMNMNNNPNYPYLSNLVTSVKRRSSTLSNLLFNHQNRENSNSIELKNLDAYNFS